MSSKVRLWVNFILIAAAFTLIVIAVGAIFQKPSTFLNPPGIINQVKNLNMDITVRVNEEDFFKTRFIDGQPDKNVEDLQLSEIDTTFTKEKTVLSYTISFENNSDGTIYIKVAGIYFDKYERFTTSAQISTSPGNPIVREDDDNTGWLSFSIAKPNEDDEEANIVNVALTYKLEQLNRKINNATQNLSIMISDKAFNE